MTSTTGTNRWHELGSALIQRRTAINPRYHNRGAFCQATGLKYRLVYDIEEARRDNFGSSTLAAIEAAYQLEPGSIKTFLDGGNFGSAGAAQPAVRQSVNGGERPLTVAQTFDAKVFTGRVRERLAHLAAQGDHALDGETVFDPDGEDPLDLGMYVAGGMATAWDIALGYGFTVDVAADLAGRTWAKAGPRWAGRDAGHRVSRLNPHAGQACPTAGHLCLFVTRQQHVVVYCSVRTHTEATPASCGH